METKTKIEQMANLTMESADHLLAELLAERLPSLRGNIITRFKLMF